MKNNNPKFAFYYLLSLVALIFTAVSSAIIIFQIINKSVSDFLLDNTYSNDGGLRFGISALFVAAPIFFLMLNFINKGLRKNELEKDSSLRRWLTYFILFVSAVIILGSLIGILNSFLSGEMTLKFALKTITVLIISILVFSYYFYDIKRDNVEKKDRNIKIFFIISLVLILAVFISSFFFVESPQMARKKRLDQIIINKVSSIESVVNSYYDLNKELPERIEDISLSSGKFYFNEKDLYDPETGEKIEYRKIGDREFEICANFRTSSDYLGGRYYYADKKFNPGKNCFKGNLWSEIK